MNGGAGCDEWSWRQYKDDAFFQRTDNMEWTTYGSGYSFAQVEATREKITYTMYDSTTLDVEEKNEPAHQNHNMISKHVFS